MTGRERKKVEARKRHNPWLPGCEYMIDARRPARARVPRPSR
jgi:hypothetical protein